MNRFLLILCALAIPACTTLKENGKTVFFTGANAAVIDVRTPAGTTLHIQRLDHVIIYREVGNSALKVGMGAASMMATGGAK